MKLPTEEQEVTIRKIWSKMKTKGWRYVKLHRVETDNSLVILMLDPGKNKHYLRISPDGKWIFLSATMVGAF